MQVCSPTRASLLSSRYSYNIGMDGNVLTGKDQRCMPTNMSTVGDQMKNNGVATAMIGKYDAGYSSWACTPNCRGFDYWLGYYGAAEDYYLHGSKASLDFHENYDQAPQYRNEYSTNLFSRKAVEWIGNATASGGQAGTFLYLAYQAVHGPIEAPPLNYSACAHIKAETRATYCAMMQSLDAGIETVTAAYRRHNLFDDTLWLFLADNGGMPAEGGFNVPSVSG
jgi:arylsulfatase B